MEVKEKTQIIYVPDHANGDTSHSACEVGFVTHVTKTWVFVRFWMPNMIDMRTKLNSEPCAHHQIVVQNTVEQQQVEDAWEKYVKQKK